MNTYSKIELGYQHPWIDSEGNERADLECHYGVRVEYTEDDEGNIISKEEKEHYMIKQLPTNIIYAEAVDLYPCKYTYEVTEEVVEVLQEEPCECEQED